MWGKIILVFIILGILAGGGYYYLSMQNNTTGANGEAGTSVTPQPSNTPTPEAVDRATYTIEVQNGGGVAGAAGDGQSLLEEAGFTVLSTGNADGFDYTETVIRAGEDVDEAWLDELKEVLREDYEVQSRVEEITGATDADVIVIIGDPSAGEDEEEATEEEDEEATPTPAEDEDDETPTPTESE